MISPEAVNLLDLPSVPLEKKSNLPKVPAIYFAIDSLGVVQYIGRSLDLKKRWRGHHNYRFLEHLGGVKIAYLACPPSMLKATEKALIDFFDPPLNGGKPDNCATQPIFVIREIRTTVVDLDKKIKRLREASGRSAQSLATEAGISTAYWYQIEKEERAYITEPVLRGIERALGVDLGVTFP